MKLEHSFILYVKINLKWFNDLILKHDTIKLQEKIGKILFSILFSNVFLNLCYKVKEMKAKINILDLIKLKSFYIGKEMIHKVKRQPMVWEKIFANNSTNERLRSKIYK